VSDEAKRERVTTKAFVEGDVYIDYPYEKAKFRYERATLKVYRYFYGEPEMEIDSSSHLYMDAQSGGWRITRAGYLGDLSGSRLTARFREALVWAAELHATQTRKGGDTPYVAHLMAVASTVIEHGGDEDQAIAALLHDAIEDQGGDETRQEMRHRFGDRVVAIVDACTDTDETPKPPWRVRKERYIAHLAEIPDDALLISLADKYQNVSAIWRDYQLVGEQLWDRFSGLKDGTLWYYRSLATAYAAREGGWLAAEVDRIVGELERLAATEPDEDRDAPLAETESEENSDTPVAEIEWVLLNPGEEREVGKTQFMTVYLQHGGGYGPPGNEQAPLAWERDYERPGWRYFIHEAESPEHDQMHAVSHFGSKMYRIYFMTD
jgi:hypothetical protein